MVDPVSSTSSTGEPTQDTTSSSSTSSSQEATEETSSEESQSKLSPKEQDAVDRFLASDFAKSHPEQAAWVEENPDTAVNAAQQAMKNKQQMEASADETKQKMEDNIV